MSDASGPPARETIDELKARIAALTAEVDAAKTLEAETGTLAQLAGLYRDLCDWIGRLRRRSPVRPLVRVPCFSLFVRPRFRPYARVYRTRGGARYLSAGLLGLAVVATLPPGRPRP